MRRSLFASLLILFLLTPSGPSQGGLYDTYQDMTRAEKWLALRYFWQLPSVYRAATFARNDSTARYPQLSGQDDQRDAHRHSTWNGSMTRRLESERAAERWANAHEEFPGNPAVRKAMDLANNRTGRALVWAARTRSGPWWWRRTRFPTDGEIANTMQRTLDQGRLLMIQEVNGQRDPQAGALVPTTTP